MVINAVITLLVVVEITGNNGLQKIFEREVQETHQHSST